MLSGMGGRVLPSAAMQLWQKSVADPSSAVSALEEIGRTPDNGGTPVLLPVTFDCGTASPQQVLECLDGVPLLMVYTRPESFLLSTMSEQASPSLALQKWCTSSRAMLEVIHRHRKRAVLFDAVSAFTGAATFKKHCRKSFGLQYSSKDVPGPLHVEYKDAQRLIAAQIVAQSAEAQDLLYELEASAEQTGVLLAPPKVNFENLLLYSRREVEWEQLQEENALLLSQLHQVQRELEGYYLQLRDAELKLASMDRSLRARAKKLKQELARAQDALSRIQLSRSWKLTKPLRTIRAFLGRRSAKRGGA